MNKRCAECGWFIGRDGFCPHHPEEFRIRWTPTLEVAEGKLKGWLGDGYNLEWKIESAKPHELWGTTRGDLAVMLALGRKWSPRHFEESTDLPEVGPKRDLYG